LGLVGSRCILLDLVGFLWVWLGLVESRCIWLDLVGSWRTTADPNLDFAGMCLLELRMIDKTAMVSQKPKNSTVTNKFRNPSALLPRSEIFTIAILFLKYYS
jgi:hypothetical protein